MTCLRIVAIREHRKQSLAPESECVTRGTRRGRERENPETAGSEALTSQSPGWSGPVPRALASPVSVHNIKSISESCTLLNILYNVKSLNLYGLGERMLALSTLVHIRSSILLYLCSDDDVDDGRSLVWELNRRRSERDR